MTGRGLPLLAVVAVLSTGCTFDGSGNGGEGSETGEGTGSAGEATGSESSSASSSSTTDASTTDASTTDASTTDASTTDASTTDASTTDASTTDASTTDPTTTTTGDGDGDCNGPAPEVTLHVADATIVPPMMTASVMLGEFAYSVVEGDGEVTFTWDQECDAEYFVWGLVWDTIPGVQDMDPDSYWFDVDDGMEVEWVYGCTTEGAPVGWSWQPLTLHDPTSPGAFCDAVSRVLMTVPAGQHSITLRNREFAQDANTSAAVIRLLLTEDEQRVPDLTND